MGDGSRIEWCDASWNPLAGCSYVSPGCLNCYAARETAGRLSHLPLYAGLAQRRSGALPPAFTGEVRAAPERITQPLHWQRPRRVFVNSMSDLFHPAAVGLPPDPTVGDQPYLAEVLAVMACPGARRHQFQVLTKRPKIAAALLSSAGLRRQVNDALARRGAPPLPDDGWPPNLWLGTSIELAVYRYRIRHLQEAPVAVRFLSLEPLLGPLGPLGLTGISWVIVGGESGPGARPMDPAWAREVRDQCVDAGVPFFFKQWGEWAPASLHRPVPAHHGGVAGVAMARVGKRAAGRELDGRTWDEMPEAVPA